jgi:small subunit ribosomal protein S6
MAKISANYEAVFIIDPAQGEEGIAALVAKFKGLVENYGTVTEVDEWGKRRLAYPINDLTEGYYVLISFNSAPSFPAEMDRIFKITDGILRSMIVCVDEK